MTIRNKSERYTAIPDQLLEDERFTWEEKGLMCLLLARADRGPLDITAIAKESRSNKQAIRALVKELVNSGYLEDNRNEGKT